MNENWEIIPKERTYEQAIGLFVITIYQIINLPNDKFAKICQKIHLQQYHPKRHPHSQEQKGTQMSKLLVAQIDRYLRSLTNL